MQILILLAFLQGRDTVMKENIRQKDSEAYKIKREIAVKAYNLGCVIFSHETKKVYTPREFMDSDETVVVKRLGMQDYHNFTLHYAKYAIAKKLEDLRKAHEEFDAFMLKMLDAFQLNPQELKTKKQ